MTERERQDAPGDEERCVLRDCPGASGDDVLEGLARISKAWVQEQEREQILDSIIPATIQRPARLWPDWRDRGLGLWRHIGREKSVISWHGREIYFCA